MEQPAARVVEIGERGLAQQVVAEAEAAVGAAEEAAFHRGEHGLGWRQRGELGAVERPAGDGGELGGPARRLVERGDRGADRTAQRGRRALVTVRGRASALQREQGVAVGRGNDALALGSRQRGHLVHDVLDLGRGSSGSSASSRTATPRPRAAWASASTSSRRGVIRRVSTSNTGRRSIRRAR